MVLNVHSGIAKPRSFKDAMATAALAGHPEIVLTNLLQIDESNPGGIRFHLIEYFRNATHVAIVALLIFFTSLHGAVPPSCNYLSATKGKLAASLPLWPLKMLAL